MKAENTSLTSVKSIITTDQQKNTDKVPVVDMVEFHNHEQFYRLESTLTKSIVVFVVSFPLFVEI
jgi:hypothetical protein